MATFTKTFLSASVNGRQTFINASASGSATSIHTCPASGAIDEVWLYATNLATASVTLGVWWGGTTTPNDLSYITVPNQSGRILVADGRLLQSGSTVSAFANISQSINVDGFVNRIT